MRRQLFPVDASALFLPLSPLILLRSELYSALTVPCLFRRSLRFYLHRNEVEYDPYHRENYRAVKYDIQHQVKIRQKSRISSFLRIIFRAPVTFEPAQPRIAEKSEYSQDYEIKGYVVSCPGTDIMALRDGLNEEGPAGFTAKSIGEEILMDDEIMGHADLYSIINKETFPEVYILTTPTDSLLYNEAVKYDQFLSENNIAHVYKEYVGKENEIGHVFNIKNMDYAESIEANQDIVSYLQEKIGQ